MEVFDTSIVEQIEMKMIRPSNFAVRDKFQESLEMESLMSSIKEHGLLQPILIRPKLNGFEIVAGHTEISCMQISSLEIHSMQNKGDV